MSSSESAMHPFNRLSHCIGSYKTCSSQRKERSCGKNADRQNDIDEDDRRSQNSTETSSNHEQALKSTQHSQKQSVPVINVMSEVGRKSPRKISDILKAKEKALLSNSSIPWAESAERLGPNKNSIIKESIHSTK